MLRIIPLGGLGEVGKNMTVFEYEDRIVVVDEVRRAGEVDPFGRELGLDVLVAADVDEQVDDVARVHGPAFAGGAGLVGCGLRPWSWPG